MQGVVTAPIGLNGKILCSMGSVRDCTVVSARRSSAQPAMTGRGGRGTVYSVGLVEGYFACIGHGHEGTIGYWLLRMRGSSGSAVRVFESGSQTSSDYGLRRCSRGRCGGLTLMCWGWPVYRDTAVLWCEGSVFSSMLASKEGWLDVSLPFRSVEQFTSPDLSYIVS